MYVDAHCHLEKATYGEELAAVIARAEHAGLGYFVAVGASGVSAGAQEAADLAQTRPNIFSTAGVHPHEAAAAHAEPRHFDIVEALLQRPKTVAVGEVGLDYHYDHSPRPVQREVFVRFLRLAQAHNKPVMLHIREAHADCCALLDEVGLPARGGVVHCFTGGPDEARAYLDRGLYLSIPGVVTFKNAEPLREAVRQAPVDRLFIETDCPYLAPVPHRGKRNEPAFVVHTARAVAALVGLSEEALAERTSSNAIAFFGLHAEIDKGNRAV